MHQPCYDPLEVIKHLQRGHAITIGYIYGDAPIEMVDNRLFLSLPVLQMTEQGEPVEEPALRFPRHNLTLEDLLRACHNGSVFLMALDDERIDTQNKRERVLRALDRAMA